MFAICLQGVYGNDSQISVETNPITLGLAAAVTMPGILTSLETCSDCKPASLSAKHVNFEMQRHNGCLASILSREIACPTVSSLIELGPNCLLLYKRT